ncbi:hypothetical protein NQ038_00560 [Brevibacterium sp. 50QC2O2]|jgi:hypothetical protein|uniref:hypothetical protein n=1 Tax=Brevibacterium sp. 50QC2O2 TaxID=2968459 RepID=UPI00211C2407|nr:hypothetical protein [Brevibacterium sp. 50QC2O2]MCQ9387149.1 hypothetical protein [Brevibacterium sp. 50QC2O2]
MSASVAPIKVDAKTDQLIGDAAHFLKRSKKSIVDDAVREYIAAHRDEIQAAALESLKLLDGSTKRSVSLLSGMSADELDALGGFEQSAER